jgi:lipoic acid synthetase
MQELPVISTIDNTLQEELPLKKPNWLRVKLPLGESYKHVRGLVDKHKLKGLPPL